MEINRSQLEKTFFGNYKAADVDRVLDDVESYLKKVEEERAEETERVNAASSAAEELTAEMGRVQETLTRLQAENARLQEESTRQKELNRGLGKECLTRREEAQKLRKDLERLLGEVDEIRTELDLANSQTALLNKRLALQRRELDEKDRLLHEDPIGEANKRAEQILQAATNTSKQMIDDAEAMRSRALAAVRAAYFNTMGFRQNLEERFGTLQSDLDQSVRMLRLIETEDESEDPEFIQEKW